jgi:hypothetical protein
MYALAMLTWTSALPGETAIDSSQHEIAFWWSSTINDADTRSASFFPPHCYEPYWTEGIRTENKVSETLVEEDSSVPVDLESLAKQISSFLTQARVESFFAFSDEAGESYGVGRGGRSAGGGRGGRGVGH